MNRGILLGGSVALIIVAGIFFWPKLGQSPHVLPDQISGGTTFSPEQESAVCTMDVKMCPDGTYVGRSGPLCEFEVCRPEGGVASPVEGMDMWQTYTSNELTFRYPSDFGTVYVSPTYWPPVIEKSVSTEPYICPEGGFESQAQGKTEKRILGGREYCRTVMQALYEKDVKDYVYVIENGSEHIHFQLSVRSAECDEYRNVERDVCSREKVFFDLDSVIDQIYRTVEFK